MKHLARKRFGQHFLSDSGIIDAIVQAINPQPGDPMVEIGPGLAALTQPLVERLGRLTVIELDRDLAKRLRSHPQLHVIESDVLNVDFSSADIAPAAPENVASQAPEGWTAEATAPSAGEDVADALAVYLRGVRRGLHEHAYDALAVATACLDAER